MALGRIVINPIERPWFLRGIESKNSPNIFYGAVQIAAQQNVVGAETIFEDLATFYAKASAEAPTPAPGA